MKKMTAEENLALCKAFLSGSEDPILGTGQKSGQLWTTITANYNERFKPTGCEARTDRALETKWAVIRASVAKFCGFYAQILDLQVSGTNVDDTLNAALHEYKDKVIKPAARGGMPVHVEFKYVNCWDYLKDKPKWTALLDPKRSTADASALTSTPSRPPGVKASKRVKLENAKQDATEKELKSSALQMAQAMSKKAAAHEVIAHMQLFATNVDALNPVGQECIRLMQEEVLDTLRRRKRHRISSADNGPVSTPPCTTDDMQNDVVGDESVFALV